MPNKEFTDLVHSDDLGLKLNGLFQVVALVTQLKPEDRSIRLKSSVLALAVTMDDKGGDRSKLMITINVKLINVKEILQQ